MTTGARPRRGNHQEAERGSSPRRSTPAPRGRRPLERAVEARFVRRCREAGALARKMRGLAGDPDRQVFAPYARTCLVELKRPGEAARKLQRKRHEAFRRHGFEVFVLDTVELVEGWAKAWLGLL